MQPAVTGLAEATGSSLSAIDVGGAATAVMGFGSSMGAIIIPLCVAVNIAMLVARLTDCVNVDVFNLHQNASMGAIVGVYSGSFLYGALTAALFHVWALIAADLGAKNNENSLTCQKVLRSLTRLPIPTYFSLIHSTGFMIASRASVI